VVRIGGFHPLDRSSNLRSLTIGVYMKQSRNKDKDRYKYKKKEQNKGWGKQKRDRIKEDFKVRDRSDFN
jgi:hypothetical protein